MFGLQSIRTSFYFNLFAPRSSATTSPRPTPCLVQCYHPTGMLITAFIRQFPNSGIRNKLHQTRRDMPLCRKTSADLVLYTAPSSSQHQNHRTSSCLLVELQAEMMYESVAVVFTVHKARARK
ncbi:hypothetical protein CBL_10586 [Carabus blaptoides fortunei]